MEASSLKVQKVLYGREGTLDEHAQGIYCCSISIFILSNLIWQVIVHLCACQKHDFDHVFEIAGWRCADMWTEREGNLVGSCSGSGFGTCAEDAQTYPLMSLFT